MLDTLLGNEQLKQDLKTALASGHLPHSILLCGEKGLGAGFVAHCLASDYLYPDGGDGARQVMAGQSAEVMLVEGEGASGNIKVDRIRAIRQQIFSTSLSANGRVVLIRDAHKLAGNQGEAANALLKVLEEPPQGVLFLLTVPSEALLLPTLRSRCSIYTLAPIAKEPCLQALQKQAPKARNLDALYDVFGGNYGTLLRYATEKTAMTQYETATSLVGAIATGNTYETLVQLAKLEKDRAKARAFLQLLRQICLASLRTQGTLAPQHAAHCITALGQADARLAGNVSTKLVLTCLADTLTACG